jgi:hypothetical protein
MRQDWLAEWEVGGVQHSHAFTSLNCKVIARTQFQLELMNRRLPVPDEYQLEPIGEPYAERLPGSWVAVYTGGKHG